MARQRVQEWALSFHLDSIRGEAPEVNLLKGALVGGDRGEVVHEGVLSYRLPRTAPRGPKRIGASETLGVFGGIEDRGQAIVSAIAERNIGDLTVYLVSEALATSPGLATERSVLMIFGPPLPKVVGRLASLRFPRSLSVCWLYAFPGSDWFDVFPGWTIASRTGHQPSKLWMEDEIIVEDSPSPRDAEYRVAWLNQFVSYESVYEAAWVREFLNDPTDTPWAGKDIDVPSVLALSMLLTLGARRLACGWTRPKSGVVARDQLAGAFLGLENAMPTRAEMAAKVQRVDDLINEGVLPHFAEVERAGGGLVVDDLPELVENWASISERIKQ